MKTRTVILWVALLSMSVTHSFGLASSRADAEECAKTKSRIRAIQDRMRSGYTARQGVRYEAKLRELRAKRRRVCR